MPSPGFTEVFGGQIVYPSQNSYLPLNISANVILQWPIEQSAAGSPIVADIMDVTATAGGLSIAFSDARQVTTGYTALFSNVGGNTFSVTDTSGNVIAAITSGTAWMLYLVDNSTANGTWHIFQFGAGTSTTNAAALAGFGLKAITTTLNTKIAIEAKNADYVLVAADRASCIEWTGANGALTSPDPAVVGSDWYCSIKNNGTGNATFTPVSGTIDGSASKIFAPGNSAFVLCDGVNFFTVGYGQTVNSIFDYVVIDVSGTGDLVLAGAQLNRISYKFTGVLTGNRNIIVPTLVQQYWVDNETTGGFVLQVKTAAGTGIAVARTTRNILFCDGTNVLNAVSFGSTGFIDGTAAAPSIFFTNSPGTGFYSPAANSFAASSNGVLRWSVDSTGHQSLNAPDDSTGPTMVINAAVSAFGLQVTSAFSAAAAHPLLSLISTAANGFATLSISGNGIVGTDDFALFQNGTNFDSTVINRHATANLNFTAGGSMTLTCGGVPVAIFSPTGANAVIGNSATLNSIGFRTLTQTTIGAAGAASALPANPLGYVTLTVNGAGVKIPYYNA